MKREGDWGIPSIRQKRNTVLKMQGTSCENPKDGLFSRIHPIYSLTPGDKIYSTENRVVSMEKISKK